MADARNNTGVWDDSKYILRSKNANSSPALTIINSYVEIDGLQIDFYRDVGTSDPYAVDMENGTQDEITIHNCIVRRNPTDTATAIDAYGLIYYETAVDGYVYFYNNLIYGFNVGSGVGIHAYNTYDDTTAFIYNNTITNCKMGVYTANGHGIAINNLFTGCGQCFDAAPTLEFSDYNATDSATFGTACEPSANDSVNAVYSFTDAGASNWTLTSGFAGDDLSSNPDLAFSTDILG